MAGPLTMVKQNASGAIINAQQPISPNLTPADVAALLDRLTPLSAKFRQSSSPQDVPLNARTLTLAQEDSTELKNVGLGVGMISEHVVILTLQNTSASTLVVDIDPWFPWGMLTQTLMQINGGATPYAVSGKGGLLVWARG